MAQSKRERLVARATQTAPRQDPKRLTSAESQKQGYRIVPVSLYTPEADWIDEISSQLKRAGNPKANRSMVMREAIALLKEVLGEKDPDEMLQFFIQRHRQNA
jgi:hypothetical protein